MMTKMILFADNAVRVVSEAGRDKEDRLCVYDANNDTSDDIPVLDLSKFLSLKLVYFTEFVYHFHSNTVFVKKEKVV